MVLWPELIGFLPTAFSMLKTLNTAHAKNFGISVYI